MTNLTREPPSKFDAVTPVPKYIHVEYRVTLIDILNPLEKKKGSQGRDENLRSTRYLRTKQIRDIGSYLFR